MYLHQLSYKRKLLLVILFYTILHFSINAQDKSNERADKCYWLKLGLGSGIRNHMSGLSIGGNIAYQFGTNLLSIRSVFTGETQFRNFFFFNEPFESFWDIGTLYGKNIKTKYLFTSIAIGIGVIGGMRRGRYLYTVYGWPGETHYYEKLPFFTIGIPIEAQISWIPTSFCGMGITAFANLNRRNSFVGILLSKLFGKLK